MKNKLEIELKFNRKDFEEVYFYGNQGSYWNSNITKKPFQNMIISGLIFSLFLYYWLLEGGIQVTAIISGLVFTLLLIIFLNQVFYTWKLRKEVRKYLDTTEKIQSHKLILTNKTFEIEQENEKITELWSDFIEPDINKMFVYLKSKSEDYLIPKKSMTELEFDKFKSILQERIMNKK